MISMSGHLVGPLFLCLKEPPGRLTENVKKSIFQAKNIILTCSKSGKLSTSLLQYWRDNVLGPAIGTDKFLLRTCPYKAIFWPPILFKNFYLVRIRPWL